MLSYALIGCGRIAPHHITAALANSGISIAALCDLLPENAQKLLEAIPEPQRASVKLYTDYKRMLAEQGLALCAVATESGKHAAIALDCVAAGANVIIEKPIALSLKDADAIIAAGRERGVWVCACHQNRFNKSIQKMREAIEGGRFGKLMHATVHVRWNRNEGYYTQAPWRGTWAQDGGALMNQSIHGIDLLRWMMGDEITEVFAYTDRLMHPYLEAEDLGVALVRFKNGGYGVIEGTTYVYPNNLEETLYIFGEKGTAKAGGKSANILEEWRFAGEDAEAVKAAHSEAPSNVYGFGHTQLYADMLSAVEEGRAPYVDGAAGRRALELVLAIYKSAKEGRPVRLPLSDFSTMDMTEMEWGGRS